MILALCMLILFCIDCVPILTCHVLLKQGEPEPFIRNVFTLNTCASIVGSDVISYDSEVTLLESWAEFVRETDPDLITGYNINNFDFPYLINRFEKLFLHHIKCFTLLLVFSRGRFHIHPIFYDLFRSAFSITFKKF